MNSKILTTRNVSIISTVINAFLGNLGRSLPAVGIVIIILAVSPVGALFGNSERVRNPEKTSDSLLFGVGSDGDFTVTAADTVLNNYAVLASNANAGDSGFSVTNITDLNSPIPQLGPIAPGDLLMIIQMQGAGINTTDTVNYGDVTALNSAGLYEFVTIGSIAGNTITINDACIAGLRNSYTAAGRTQVVRVPQFNNVTVDAGASVIPAVWNGASGGVLVLHVARYFTLNGSLNANAAGFRGGIATNNGFTLGSVLFRTTNVNNGAPKGEGIAGSQADYDLLNGRFGRGAPANGGGGGNSTNSAGGGGANGSNGNTWTGQGVMPGTVTGASAWQLDPGYIANGNALTNSSGGGRGGYTWSNSNQDALTLAPGNAAWGGDSRREAGGMGGRPVDNDPAGRLFLGGGGGAGDMNNNAGGSGGRGGGLVYVMAAVTEGAGSITANGANGANTTNLHNDAPGGGGGGGTVVLYSQLLTAAITINANGGNGGSQSLVTVNINETEGPGGGGGGGYIALRAGMPTRTTSGGTGGVTASNAVTEFPRNGATDGAIGQPDASVTTIPVCLGPTAANVSISGRVMTPEGRGLRNALVTITDMQGISRHERTQSFGYFRLDDILTGETYVIAAGSRRYQFEPRVLTVNDELTDVDFIAVTP